MSFASPDRRWPRPPVRLVVATTVALAALATPTAVAAAPTTGPGNGPAVPAGRAKVPDARPWWASAAADQGQVDPNSQLTARVYLAGRDPRGLAAYAQAVSDPHSRTYGHYLTPDQVRSRFGPSSTQVAAVRSWLTGTGLSVTGTNEHYVSVHGTVTAVQRAFGVALHSFHAQGGTHRAPAGPVNVPAPVAGAVLAVTGLDDSEPVAHPAESLPGPAPVTLRADPCSTYYGQRPAADKPKAYGHTGVWTQCGDTPQQIRSLYGVDGSGVTGTGQTIAIVDAYAAPTIGSDVHTYTGHYGIADFKHGQFTQSLPATYTDVAKCGGAAWYNEENIDVEAAHDIAPGANIVYVAASSCHGPDLEDALNRIVDHHLASIVSNSWSLGPSTTVTPALRSSYEQLFQRATAEGIGMYFASGDCGDEDPATSCGNSGQGKPETDFPPEDPWVTSVGGTSLAVDAHGKELFQSGWGDLISRPTSDGTGWTPAPGTGYPAAFDGGAGGGTSGAYAQPAYQKGIVPATLSRVLPDGTATSAPMRVEPDVAADADNNTGLLVGQTQTYPDGSTRYHETRWGGTSLACPLFAAIQALAQQVLGKPIGFANPAIYARYHTGAIEDVTDSPPGAGTMYGVVRNDYTNNHDPASSIATTLYTFGHDGHLHATAGYDNVTGVGTPSARYIRSYARNGR